MKQFILVCIALVSVLQSAKAQPPLYFDPDVPVHRQGEPLGLAWAGGLNYVQLSSMDLNGDGLMDLFLFDRTGNKVITLLNTGGTGIGAYRVTREFDHVYPFSELHDWVLARDYNCDGKMDIFTYSQAGFSVYRNTSDENGLSFELTIWRVESNYVTTGGDPIIANLFVSSVDLPGIVDVDGDGDLDILPFGQFGISVEYHKNLSQETYGHCDSLIYEVSNRCWGFFREGNFNSTITLFDTCTYNVPNPEMPLQPNDPAVLRMEEGSRAHAGSTVTPLDLDGNGLMDLLIGDIASNHLVALYNGGAIDLASMTEQDPMFPNYDQPVDLLIFPAAFYEDVDNDGRRDLVASPNAYSFSQNFRSMWFYKNNGTDTTPHFNFQMENLFQERMIEMGRGAYPVPFDHDGDGLMDLIVANHTYFSATELPEWRMTLLLNTGSASQPAFELVDDHYQGISFSGDDPNRYPAFGDIDGDGDMDMYLGDHEGYLHFYKNVSTGGPAQFQLEQINITDMYGIVMDVGQDAMPQLFDLDGDGLLDFVIGERNGNLNYYRNTGSATLPQWELISEQLGGVSTVPWYTVTGYSVPFLYENGSGEKEILLGSESGWLYHYGDIDGNIGGTWTLLDSTYLDIYEGERTAPCLYDFTGDGVLDLVVGNARGGLSFWRSDDHTSTQELSNLERGFSIQPNPASDQVELVHKNYTEGSWVIRNGIGQEIHRMRTQGQRTTLSLSGMASGIYHVHFEGAASMAPQQLVVIGSGRN